jgi:arginine decarboxylase
MLIGNRVPRDFFIARGKGESDITVHAGSYHLALRDAGIEMCNIMTYSSILPKIAREIKKPHLVHGSVMETIMAAATCRKGEKCSAGIIYGWLFDRKSGEKCGGLVCEHNGSYSVKEIRGLLRQSINELYVNGYDDKYDLRGIRILTNSIKPTKSYGTALVALCFTSYEVPLQ